MKTLAFAINAAGRAVMGWHFACGFGSAGGCRGGPLATPLAAPVPVDCGLLGLESGDVFGVGHYLMAPSA